MKPVSNSWVVIQWIDGRWKPVTKKRASFREHVEEFDELADTAHLHEPPRHYKSIHVCWLDDIKNWDPPYEVAGQKSGDPVRSDHALLMLQYGRFGGSDES